MINTLFFPLAVGAKEFYATDVCIGCGNCTKYKSLSHLDISKTDIEGERSCIN